ncbi:uncharacterized protein UV8b_07390 [Ustilaginoidea virens]|uniref:Uncharacterized protein n=1 Tax=Ustilaginoidea virens TaxID=1159556 RepID=A0A8E5HWZ2_USTVR|nr:uncharacterized protein UV8b_07390 [Ustilaginoidea virens]QUC23149.1 hypothetical protein UV8b_07390 [Ustilaginoidea virens]
MPSSIMTFLTGLAALFVAFAGASAQTWSSTWSSTTLQPLAMGTSTLDGALLVSINYCTVIVNTQCQVSVTTSLPSQASPVSSTPIPTTSPTIPSVPIPTPFSVPPSAAASSPEAPPLTATQTASYGSETTDTTQAAATTSSSSAGTSVVTTAAAAGIKALPGAAWDAAILAIAVLL